MIIITSAEERDLIESSFLVLVWLHYVGLFSKEIWNVLNHGCVGQAGATNEAFA